MPGQLSLGLVLLSAGFLGTTWAEESSSSPATSPSMNRYPVEWREPIQPARLSADAEKRALTQALYAEALRVGSNLDHSTPDAAATAALPLFQEIVKLDPSFIQAHLKIALGLIQTGQQEKAVTYLRGALIENPNSLEIKSALAYALRVAKHYDEALKIAREILAVDPQQIIAYRVIFEVYAEKGQSDQAIKMVQLTVRRNTFKADFWINLARLYADLLVDDGTKTSKEIAQDLLPIYEKALACGKPTSELLLLVSDCETLLEHNEKAMVYLKQAYKISPPDVELSLRLANLEMAAGQKDEAIVYYEQAYNLEPDFEGLGETLAKIYSSEDQNDKAIAILEEMVRRSPTRIDLYVDLGEAYEKTNQLDKAEQNYQEAVALTPRTSMVFLQLALVQMAEKKFDAATQTLAVARERFPASARVPFVQALEAREQEKYGDALALLQTVRNLAVDQEANVLNEVYYLELSTIQELDGKKVEAEETLREGLKKFPDDESLLNAMAYNWAEEGTNLEEALKYSKKAVASSPGDGAFLDTLGWIYYKLDQPQQAVALLEQAANATRNDEEVVTHLAEVYAHLNRLPEAILLWEKIVKDDPANTAIKDRLEKELAQAKNVKTR